jgi:Ca2+-binding RTX toxin-like protein
MTIITFNGPFGYDLDWDLTPIAAGTIAESTASTVVIAFNDDETLTLTGTFSGGTPTTRPTDGTIDVITWNDSGEETVIETSITVADFFSFLDAEDGSGLVAQLLAGNDTINGSAGNDSLIGLGGNDQISTGGGLDNINAGDGDDTIILNGVRTGGSINGGNDEDTLVASMAAASAPTVPGDTYSTVQLTGALSNVETVQFSSLAGERLRVAVGSWHANQITTLTGGAGSDQLQIIALSNVSTSFTLAPLTLTDWNADDNVMLVGVSQGPTPSNFTLDSSAYSGQAVLIGGAGNDTLTSGAGNDFVLTNGGGADTVSTGAGNDTIIPQGAVTGSNFDGGADTDTANYSANSVGITVNLTAGTATDGANTDTLTGIENVTGSGHNDFLTGDGNANSLVGGDGSDTLIGHGGNDTIDGGALFDTAVFVLPSSLAGTLQVVAGTSGKVNINRLDGGVVAEKLFEITPTGPGAANVTGFGSAAYHGTDTVTTSENLTFLMDGGNQANGRQVNALLSTLAVNNPTTLFVGVVGSIGNDTIDLASYPGFEGLGFGSFGNDTITGTAAGNQLYGGDGNDTLIGLGGDDLLNGGTGMNILQGGTENDTLVVDAAFAGGSQFHGGDGTDTLRVHTIAGSPVINSGLVNGNMAMTTHNFIGAPISSIERLLFQSTAGTGVTANFSLGFQIGAFVAPNQIGSGLAANAEIIGSAGFDTVQLTLSTSLVAEVAGIRTLDLPQFTFTNWTAPARAYQFGDRVLVVAVGNDALTINGSDHEGIQLIVGGAG